MGGWTPPNLIARQDLDKARQLLAKAGYRPGQLEAKLTFSTGSPATMTAVEVFQASLQRIGVNVRLNGVEFAPAFQKLQRFARTKNAADAEDTMTLNGVPSCLTHMRTSLH